MSKEKKGFVLYFDNAPMLENLPSEQRGELLSALFAYAQAVTGDLSIPEEVVVRRFPKLRPETAMAFSFMAVAIRRDTQAWNNRRDAYQRGALERERGKQSAQPDVQALQKYVKKLSRERENQREKTEESVDNLPEKGIIGR